MEKKKNKKRITHIGNDLDNEYESTDQSICLDLVDSIMESMNTDIKTVSNNERREVNQHINKMTQMSSNDSSAQALKIADAKFKKLSVARKFPLMEKSQKVLQQLKHNRSMPKPRAHLHSTEKSLKKISVPSVISQNKKKPLNLNEKAKETSTTLSKYPHPNRYTTDSNLKQYIDKQRKIAREKSNSDKNISTRINPFQPDSTTHNICQTTREDNRKFAREKSNSDNNISTRINRIQSDSATHNINQTTSDDNRNDNDHLSHTTDSEYEKFIKEIKPKLKKKTKKAQKAKGKVSLKSKKLEKNFAEQYDSDSDNSEASESAYKKVKQHPKPKTKPQNQYIDEKPKKLKEAVSRKNRKCKKGKKNHTSEQSNSNVQKANLVSVDNAKTQKTSFEDRSKSVNNLQRSSSSESLVEHYDSNFHQSDSSDDNQSFNNTVIDSEPVKSNLPVKDNIENVSTNFKDTDNSINFEAIVDNEPPCFQKEAGFISSRYPLRSKNHNSEKVTNIEISCAEASSNSISTLQSEVEDHAGDSLPETSVIDKVIGLNFADSNAQELLPNKGCNDSKDTVSGKKDSRPFIPFEEFCGRENDNLIEKSQKYDSDESDIEIVEIVNRKNTVPEYTPNSKNILNLSPVDICENEVEVISDNILGTVSRNQSSIDTDASKNVVCKIEPSALDAGRKDLTCNPEVVKQEIAEKHDPVYMTNICYDLEGDNINVQVHDNLLETSVGSTSAPGRDVENSYGSSSKALTQHKSHVEDDDIMVIEPNCETHDIKQEIQEDEDVIIEFEMKVPSKGNIVPSKGNIDNPATSLIYKRKNEYLECLENNIKSDYPLGCKIPKITSDQINPSLIEKELALFKFPEESTSINATSRSNIEYLLSKYKMEFNVYKEIRHTEASVEAGLKLVEAHQAIKLKEIRLEIDKVLKNDPQFDKIFNQCVKGKEKDSFEIPKSHLSPKSSLEFSSENSNDSKPEVIAIASTIATNSPLTFIKVENNDLSNLNISSTSIAVDPSNLRGNDLSNLNISSASIAVDPSNLRCNDLPNLNLSSTSIAVDPSNVRCKLEVDTLESSNVSHSASVDEKPELTFLGQKCNACGKDAVAACQRCAKVFFCSNKCGKQFWNDGHKEVCLS